MAPESPNQAEARHVQGEGRLEMEQDGDVAAQCEDRAADEIRGLDEPTFGEGLAVQEDRGGAAGAFEDDSARRAAGD